VKRALLICLALAAVFGVVGAVRWIGSGAAGAEAPGWYSRAAYPLAYDGAIRASARRNHLDPALVAAMIYAESQFDPRAVSDQGAVGLMQVLPATAGQIARETGGVSFTSADLQDPGINVRYGTRYLRTVLDRFGGNEVAAVAAYNAGAGAVAQWVAQASAAGHGLRVADIPYPETRAYVHRVMHLKRAYRKAYGDRLGPAS
jgi:soluble lytic murein transglycosylase